MRSPSSERGMALAELSTAVFIFGLMLMVLFVIFQAGSRAFVKGDTETHLLNTLEAVSAELTRFAERSTQASLSVHPNGEGAAFLTALDQQGQFQFFATTYAPHWQSYKVFYFDALNGTLHCTSRSVLGSAQETTPVPLEAFTGHPLSRAFTGGRPVAKEVEQARFESTPQGQLALDLRLARRQRGNSKASLSSRTVVTFRN